MSQSRRARGRPRRGAEPQLDHAELERLLVHGEFGTGPDGRPAHTYPSFRELAERFGVGKTAIQRFAQRHNCLGRRVRAGEERSTAAPTGATRAAGAPTPERMLPTIREIFVAWVGAVQRGEIAIASAGEIEKMMRIAADLDAEAQVRALIPQGVRTLEELQDLHEERIRAYAATSAGERGEIPVGLDPTAAIGERDHDNGLEPSEATAAEPC